MDILENLRVLPCSFQFFQTFQMFLMIFMFSGLISDKCKKMRVMWWAPTNCDVIGKRACSFFSDTSIWPFDRFSETIKNLRHWFHISRQILASSKWFKRMYIMRGVRVFPGPKKDGEQLSTPFYRNVMGGNIYEILYRGE